jgi:hypothetical protein
MRLLRAGSTVERCPLGYTEGEKMNGNDCKFVYVDHMLAEHRRLDQLVRRTLGSIPGWEEADTGWLPRMRAGLEEIRTELAHHFRKEEEGGCLEEAVARCPQLSADVGHIEAEHRELLASLDDLIDRCRKLGATTAAQANALDAELRRVVHKLRAHEALENRVMQRGFNVSLCDEDAGADAELPSGEPWQTLPY